jgi:hypothetical protein
MSLTLLNIDESKEFTWPVTVQALANGGTVTEEFTAHFVELTQDDLIAITDQPDPDVQHMCIVRPDPVSRGSPETVIDDDAYWLSVTCRKRLLLAWSSVTAVILVGLPQASCTVSLVTVPLPSTFAGIRTASWTS